MAEHDASRLALSFELELWTTDFAAWLKKTPAWGPAQREAALATRLQERIDRMKERLERPLVVAALGGTGSGKSTLINALSGCEAVPTGRIRPTTNIPIMVCSSELSPVELGIDPASVQVAHCDERAMKHFVLIDCPDPDTTEDVESSATNLARLRGILPHCDVLLVVGTQQKYRSYRVAGELTAAAPGARLVFVQTHADLDEDIRDDWRRLLADHYETGEMFLVDSASALAAVKSGREPAADFQHLRDFLLHELGPNTSHRIRQANFFDAADYNLSILIDRLQGNFSGIRRLKEVVADERRRLAEKPALRMGEDLHAHRGAWENRLLGEIATRWGLSPFSLVLRVWQSLGKLLLGAAIFRARSPAQMALWGSLEGIRAWKNRREQRQAEASPSRVVLSAWEEADLRGAAFILEGYAADAQLPREALSPNVIREETERSADVFLNRASADIQQLVERQAARHAGWFTRARYELFVVLLPGVILYRLGRNFFYDSWLAAEPMPLLGFDFFISAGLWSLLWCGAAVWAFTTRVRRGLNAEIKKLVQNWRQGEHGQELFSRLEEQCREIELYRDSLEQLRGRLHELRRAAEIPSKLGRPVEAV